jgi:azurin
MKILFFFMTLMLAFNLVLADDCSIQIVGSDMMKYDLQEINISSKCVSFDIKLKHGGKLPVSAMGHNIGITEESNFMLVAQLINMENGIENGYLPTSDKILFRSDMIGGGESTSLTVDPSKLDSTKSFIYFCSFPGHWAIMKGKINLL